MRRVRLIAMCLVAGTACTGAAQACTISATGVNFGAYDPRSSTAKDSTGGVTLNCPSNRSGVVSMTKGGSTTYFPRRMMSGTNQLTYNLFTNSTRSTGWGDGTGGSATSSVARGFSGTLIIYGRIPAGQNVRAGSYTDTVTVTVTF